MSDYEVIEDEYQPTTIPVPVSVDEQLTKLQPAPGDLLVIGGASGMNDAKQVADTLRRMGIRGVGVIACSGDVTILQPEAGDVVVFEGHPDPAGIAQTLRAVGRSGVGVVVSDVAPRVSVFADLADGVVVEAES